MSARPQGPRIQRGLTTIEFLVATSASSVLGTVIFVLMVGARDVFQTHTTFGEVTTQLDVSTTMLRQDIWGATGVGQSGNGVCPNNWLSLDNAADSDYPITYCIDEDDLSNRKLRRTRSGGPNWNVAQYIDRDNTTADISADPLVEMQIQVRKNVDGRDYMRTANVTYRSQP